MSGNDEAVARPTRLARAHYSAAFIEANEKRLRRERAEEVLE